MDLNELLGRFKKKDGDAKPKITGPKACGILVGQRTIHVYAGKLEAGLAGEVQAKEYPVEDGKLGAALKILLDRGEIGRNVAIGLDPTLDFLSTARADDGNQIQAQSQLGDRLAGRLPGGVSSRENKAGTNKIKLKSLLYFPRRIGMSVMEGLKPIGRSNIHLLSTTHVLYQLGSKRKAVPKKWKVEIRVFLDEPESVAVLVFKGVPVARQSVPTVGEGKAAALSSVVQRLAVAAQKELQLGEVQGIILHVDAAELPVVQPACEALKVPVLQGPAIPVSRAALATMLCNARRTGRKAPLELGSVLAVEGERPAFPLKAALPAAAALIGSAVYLWSQGSAVKGELAAMEASIEELLLEREITRPDIVDLRDGMGIEVGVAEAFLTQRVYWGQVLLEVMKATPDDCYLNEIEGVYPYHFIPKLVGDDEEDGEEGAEDARGALGRMRYLKFSVFLPNHGGGIGPERDAIANAIDNNPMINEAFPNLMNLTISSQNEGKEQRYLFNVEARPPGI